MGGSPFKAGDRKPSAHAPRANDDLLSLKPHSAFSFDGVLIGEAHSAGLFVDGNSQGIDLPAQSGMRAHIVDDLAHTHQELVVLQHRFAYSNTILGELSSFSNEPGGMGECPHGNWSVVGGHTAKLVACNERCACAQIRSTKRG
jgi:hypothetical protein